MFYNIARIKEVYLKQFQRNKNLLGLIIQGSNKCCLNSLLCRLILQFNLYLQLKRDMNDYVKVKIQVLTSILNLYTSYINV